MPTLTPAAETSTECDTFCTFCHCEGEGCDGIVCHGLDAD